MCKNATEYEDWHLHYSCVPKIQRPALCELLLDVCRNQIRGSLIRRGIKEEPNHAFEAWNKNNAVILRGFTYAFFQIAICCWFVMWDNILHMDVKEMCIRGRFKINLLNLW